MILPNHRFRFHLKARQLANTCQMHIRSYRYCVLESFYKPLELELLYSPSEVFLSLYPGMWLTIILYWSPLWNKADSKGLFDLSQTSKNLFRSKGSGIEPYSHRIIDGIGDGGKDARDIAFSHFLGAVRSTYFIAFSDDINYF